MLGTETWLPDDAVIGERVELRADAPPAPTVGAGWLRSSHANLWDEGCRRDAVRNDFVVPALVEALRHSGHSRVIDLGAGTAYVLSELRRRSNRIRGVRFTAVEQEASLCEWLDEAHGREWLDVDHRNFLDGPRKPRGPALVISAYSLLEVEGPQLAYLRCSLQFGDTLVVSVATQAAATGQVRRSEVRRPYKRDRFTGLWYPLFEHPVGTLLDAFSAFGARLIGSRAVTTASEDHHSILVFRLDG
ncbi:MAG TPA: hypothetical protein VK507_25590 [Iamia sp.]|nr:hypothetical protein [Iamia sp.]